MNNTNNEVGDVTEFGAHIINKMLLGEAPEPVSWMPQTAAWYWLFGTIIFVVLFVSLRRYYLWKTRLYLRQASELFITYGDTREHHLYASTLKRVVMQHWSELEVKTMSPVELSRYLAQKGKPLSKELCQRVSDSAYGQSSKLTQDDISVLNRWVKSLC